MADAFKIQDAIQAELDKMKFVIRKYESLNLDDFRQSQLDRSHNMRAVRSWRLNIARNIKAIDDHTKQQQRLYEILNPQIVKLNDLLNMEISIESDKDIDQFYSLRSSILNSRKLIASIYAARGRYISSNFRDDLQSVLQETRFWSKEVKKQRAKYKLVYSEKLKREQYLYDEANKLAGALNTKLPLNESGSYGSTWKVVKRNGGYKLQFNPEALISWGNKVGIVLSGYLEDNSDLKKRDVIEYIVSHWSEMFADAMYQAVENDSLTSLGEQLANKYRTMSDYDLGIESHFKYNNNLNAAIEPLHVSFKSEISKLKVTDEGYIPEIVKEELLYYTRGRFEVTINAQEQINGYSKQYKTLPIELVQNGTKPLGNEINGLKRHLKELYSLVNSPVFGSQRNSDEGVIRIEDLNNSILQLQLATTATKDFRQAFYGFKESCTSFEAWINGSWTQFGGTPSGEVHDMGWKWASAMGLTDK